MNDDLSPEALRQLYKERAAADEALRKSQEQQALYQGSEVMEVPIAEASQRDLFSANFAKLDASLKNIDYNLEATHLQRMEQSQKDRTAQISLETKISRLETKLDHLETKMNRLEQLYRAQNKVSQLRQRALITVGLVNFAVTLLFGVLILTLR